MTIIEAVTPKAKRAGRGINPPEVYAYFVEQCRANLHMVLAMSPVGDAFRSVLAHLACADSLTLLSCVQRTLSMVMYGYASACAFCRCC